MNEHGTVRPLTVALSIIVLWPAAGCERGITGPPRDPADVPGGGGAEFVEIRATDGLRFEESFVEIPVESMVRWVSASGLPHTVTPTDHDGFPRGEAEQRGWVMLEHGFGTPGVYHFHCEYHQELGMTGTIVVLER